MENVRKSILLVEDEKNVILAIKTCLEVAEYRVMVEENGEKAIARIKEEKPDAIVLDLMLPGVNGYQVCQQLKTMEETKDIPIIVLTAKTGEEDKERAWEAGADSYLTKPIRPEELWQEIQKFAP